MRYLLALVIIVLIDLQIIAQTDDFDFNLLCDSASTQADLNNCTYQQYLKLDSIINVKFDCITDILEKQIQKCKISSDSSMINYYMNLILAIKESQNRWLDLRNANMEFYDNFYEGGSMRAMVANKSAIIDEKDRINRLNDFIKEISQGHEDKICN